MKRFLFYLFIVLVLISTSSCTPNKETILKYSSDGDYDKLIEFVNKNYDDPDKSQLILLSINEIVNSNNNDDLLVLEELFYKDISDEIRLGIIRSFNNKNKLFKSMEKSNDYFFENYKDKEKMDHSIEVLKMINRYDEEQLIKYNINTFEKKYNSNEFEDAHSRLVLIREVFPNKREAIDILISKYEKLVELDIDIENIKNEISDIEKKIDEKKFDLINSDYFPIDAFVVAEIKPNYYEIALTTVGYYSLVPSDKHAYLLTSKTKFSKNSRFIMNVVKMYEEDVKLKEELGGFTQKWDVYFEITDEKKKKINSMYTDKKNKKDKIDAITENFKSMNFNIDIPKSDGNNNEESSYKTSEYKDEYSKLKDLILNFDEAWIEYVNNDSDNIFNYVVPNSTVEDNIRNFNKKDLKEDFLKIDVKDISINKNTARIRVYEKLKKDKKGTIEIKEYNWIYEAQKVNGKWLILSYTKDNGFNLNDNEDKNTEEWAEKNVEYKSNGTVKGGEITDGVDIGSIRWAKQEGFDRVVLDFYKFDFDEKGTKVSKPCYFEAKIENNKKTVITFSGARNISSDIPDFSGSDSIESIQKVYPEDDSMVQLIISYKKSASQRIFELHNPGRLVIDIKE